MVPVKIRKLFEDVSPQHAQTLCAAWENRINTEANCKTLASIKAVDALSILDTAHRLLDAVPDECMGMVAAEISVRHNPGSHRLEAFPLFSADSLLSLLVTQKLINNFQINSIDEADSFEYNGNRALVSHVVSNKASGVNAGAYLQVELADKSVCVWVMSPEEIVSAAEAWKTQVFGPGEVFESQQKYIDFMMLLRAIKTMSGLSLFNSNTEIDQLFKNVGDLYRSYFDEFKAEQRNKYAHSVQQNSRCISDQPSAIEKKLNAMKPVSKEYGVVVQLKPKHKIPEKQTDERGVSVVTDFGVGGW